MQQTERKMKLSDFPRETREILANTLNANEPILVLGEDGQVADIILRSPSPQEVQEILELSRKSRARQQRKRLAEAQARLAAHFDTVPDAELEEEIQKAIAEARADKAREQAGE